MSNPFYPLLQPGRIGTLELRNRIIMAPMGSNFAETDGTCGERIQAYYEARAKGGAGFRKNLNKRDIEHDPGREPQRQ